MDGSDLTGRSTDLGSSLQQFKWNSRDLIGSPRSLKPNARDSQISLTSPLLIKSVKTIHTENMFAIVVCTVHVVIYYCMYCDLLWCVFNQPMKPKANFHIREQLRLLLLILFIVSLNFLHDQLTKQETILEPPLQAPVATQMLMTLNVVCFVFMIWNYCWNRRTLVRPWPDKKISITVNYGSYMNCS